MKPQKDWRSICYKNKIVIKDKNVFDNFSQEVCDPNAPNYAGNLTMCPLCDRICTYFKLSASCLASQVSQSFTPKESFNLLFYSNFITSTKTK